MKRKCSTWWRVAGAEWLYTPSGKTWQYGRAGLVGRENNLCRARLEDSSSASHPCHYDPIITRAVVQLRRTGHHLHALDNSLPQVRNLSAED